MASVKRRNSTFQLRHFSSFFAYQKTFTYQMDACLKNQGYLEVITVAFQKLKMFQVKKRNHGQGYKQMTSDAHGHILVCSNFEGTKW